MYLFFIFCISENHIFTFLTIQVFHLHFFIISSIFSFWVQIKRLSNLLSFLISFLCKIRVFVFCHKKSNEILLKVINTNLCTKYFLVFQFHIDKLTLLYHHKLENFLNLHFQKLLLILHKLLTSYNPSNHIIGFQISIAIKKRLCQG